MSLFSSRTVLIGCAILAAFALGYGLANAQGEIQLRKFFNSKYPVRLHNEDYSLVNPLVAYETPETDDLREYRTLKDSIQNRVDERRDVLNRISVYYRNLGTGDWIGINESDFYYPASLLKVPVMIAYFKQAETDPKLFASRIVYRTITSGDTFDAQSSLVPGTSYSIEELIEKMIIDSDNGATYTLLEHIDGTVLNEVYTDLDIVNPGEDSSTYQISTRTYALFFRILYNATYLSPESSQKALELLAKATYRDGLMAGMPEGTIVAHKYGEHIVSADRQTMQGVELHDCGIVYHPRQQYLLCIMTQAKTHDAARDLINDVSRAVFDSVEKND